MSYSPQGFPIIDWNSPAIVDNPIFNSHHSNNLIPVSLPDNLTPQLPWMQDLTDFSGYDEDLSDFSGRVEDLTYVMDSSFDLGGDPLDIDIYFRRARAVLDQILSGESHPGVTCLLTSNAVQDYFDRLSESKQTMEWDQLFNLLAVLVKDDQEDLLHQSISSIRKIFAKKPREFLSEAYERGDFKVVSYYFESSLQKIHGNLPLKDKGAKYYCKLFDLLKGAPSVWQEDLTSMIVEDFSNFLQRYQDDKGAIIEEVVALASGVHLNEELRDSILTLVPPGELLKFLLESDDEKNCSFVLVALSRLEVSRADLKDSLEIAIEKAPGSSSDYQKITTLLFEKYCVDQQGDIDQQALQSINISNACKWIEFVVLGTQEDLSRGEQLLGKFTDIIPAIPSREVRKPLEGKVLQAYRTLLDKLSSAPSVSRAKQILGVLDGPVKRLMNNITEYHGWRASGEVMGIQFNSDRQGLLKELELLIHNQQSLCRSEKIEALLERLSGFQGIDFEALDIANLQELYVFLREDLSLPYREIVLKKVLIAYLDKSSKASADLLEGEQLKNIMAALKTLFPIDASLSQDYIEEILSDQQTGFLNYWVALLDDNTLAIPNDFKEKAIAAALKKMDALENAEDLAFMNRCLAKLSEANTEAHTIVKDKLMAAWRGAATDSFKKDLFDFLVDFNNLKGIPFTSEDSLIIFEMINDFKEHVNSIPPLLRLYDANSPVASQREYFRTAVGCLNNSLEVDQEAVVALGRSLLKCDSTVIEQYSNDLLLLVKTYLKINGVESFSVAGELFMLDLKFNKRSSSEKKEELLEALVEKAIVCCREPSAEKHAHNVIVNVLKTVDSHATQELLDYLDPDRGSVLYWPSYLTALLKSPDSMMKFCRVFKRLYPHYFDSLHQLTYDDQEDGRTIYSNFTVNLISDFSRHMVLKSRKNVFRVIDSLERLNKKGFLVDCDPKKELMSILGDKILNYYMQDPKHVQPYFTSKEALLILEELDKTFLIKDISELTPNGYNDFLILLLRTLGVTPKCDLRNGDRLPLTPFLASLIERAIINYRQDLNIEHTMTVLLTSIYIENVNKEERVSNFDQYTKIYELVKKQGFLANFKDVTLPEPWGPSSMKLEPFLARIFFDFLADSECFQSLSAKKKQKSRKGVSLSQHLMSQVLKCWSEIVKYQIQAPQGSKMENLAEIFDEIFDILGQGNVVLLRELDEGVYESIKSLCLEVGIALEDYQLLEEPIKELKRRSL
ncbi:MAG: hypothetical protein ACQEP8_00865 [Chlamydiota bacterium]